MAEIDWDNLRRIATEQSTRSYAPYSKFRVGAAALTTSGRIVSGCNVENASYGLTLCAECSLVSALHSGATEAEGENEVKLVAISVVDAQGQPCAPCGRCRQVLSEFATAETKIETASGIRLLSELLPEAFGPADL